MGRKSTKLTPYQIEYICDKCGKGSMESTGYGCLTNPPQYEHECSNCGEKKSFPVQYPQIVYSSDEEVK